MPDGHLVPGAIEPCPACGGSGFLAGGLEVCACRIARERHALLVSAALPEGDGPLPVDAAAWFARFRPEDGWPWLTVADADAGVAGALARLILAIGVEVATIEVAAPERDAVRGRIVACFGIERLGVARAARLVDRCVADGRTLVATTSLDPAAPDGLGAAIGERALLALWEHGVVC